MKERIAIIGAGRIGSVMYHALTQKKCDVAVCDRHPEKLAPLKAVHSSTQPDDILADASVVIVAVKPQSFPELASQVSVSLEGKLIISVMAGIRMETISRLITSKIITRMMPNLSLQVGEGLTAWITAEDVEQCHITRVRSIAASMGKELRVLDEEQMDSFTALVTTGSACLFELCISLERKAQKLGFDPGQARLIAEQTLIGKTELLKKQQKTAGDWSHECASPGGVTEAALSSLEAAAFSEVVLQTIDHSRKHSLMLGN